MFRYIILSVFLLGRVKILNARPLVLNGKIRQAEKAIRGVYMTIKKCSPSLPRAAYTFPPEGADQSALHVLPDTEAYWTKDALVAATGGAWRLFHLRTVGTLMALPLRPTGYATVGLFAMHKACFKLLQCAL